MRTKVRTTTMNFLNVPKAGSILQIEPDGLNNVIGFEPVSAVNSAKCFRHRQTFWFNRGRL